MVALLGIEPFGSRERRLKKISEYYEHAEECRQLAKSASAEHATTLNNMARTWENLAREREEHLARQQRIASLENGSA